MEKKERHFELTDECMTNEEGVRLYRIRCTETIPGVAEAGILSRL